MVGLIIIYIITIGIIIKRTNDYNNIKKANEKLQDKVTGLEQSVEMYKTYCGIKK